MKIDNKWLLIITCVIVALSCEKEEPLGEPTDSKVEYTLPQGLSSADSRVVTLYNKYKTFFLYKFTQKDLNWSLVQNPSNIGTYLSEEGDPQYVGAILDLLESSWLAFYPEKFLKEGMPYKVFLCKNLTDNVENPICAKYGWDNLAVNYTDSRISTLSAAEKNEYKYQVNQKFIDYLTNKGIISSPAAFFDGSNYTMSLDGFNPDAWNYYMAQGFWENLYSWDGEAKNKQKDFSAYMKRMLMYSEEENMVIMNKYPKILAKYNKLRSHFINLYNIDLQKIGNFKHQ